jgi:hypothetical protein
MCQKNCCHSELLISAVKRIALAFSLIALLFAIGLPADPQMKIVPSITTYAGNGIAVDPGDGGPAISAGIVNPARAAVDSAGNVYIVECSGSHRVRKQQERGSSRRMQAMGQPAIRAMVVPPPAPR